MPAHIYVLFLPGFPTGVIIHTSRVDYNWEFPGKVALKQSESAISDEYSPRNCGTRGFAVRFFLDRVARPAQGADLKGGQWDFGSEPKPFADPTGTRS